MNRRSTAPELQLQTATIYGGAERGHQQWQQESRRRRIMHVLGYVILRPMHSPREGMGSYGFELLQHIQLSLEPVHCQVT